MARQGWGRHTTVATGSDSGDQVSVNSWNADINKAGMLGFTGETIASATSITPTATTLILSGSTNVSTVAITNTAEYDLLYIFTSGTVTLVNTSSPSTAGDIKLLANADTDLSTTVPTILIRKGNFWYEYGGSPVTDASVTFSKIQDLATMKVIGRTAASSGVSSEVAILDEDNMASDSAVSLATQQSIKAYVDAQSHSTVTASSTTTFTNKTIDQDATGNSITNLANASIKASAGIDAAKIADGSVTNSEFKYINSLTDNAQTQIDGKSPTAGNTSLVTTGALDTGSITSNFGNINIGSSTITTTGAVATGDITTALLDVAGNNIDNVQNIIHDLSTATVALDFAGDEFQEITISANSTFTASNYAIGKSKVVVITTDATIRTLAFPAGWIWLNSSEPVSQQASKKGVLSLSCQTGAESGVIAMYAAEDNTALDNVTVSQLANGTDGELITWDTAGAPTTVPVGTATHVLTSNGSGAVPTFQAAGGSGNTFGRAVMTSDQSVNNSTTFADATELAVALDANADYGFMAMLIYDASTVADFKTTIATLTNATGIWASSTWRDTYALGAAYNIDGGGVGTKRIDTLKGTMKVGATAGDLQVQFAQKTAEVSNSRLSIGSHLVVWKEV